MNKDCFILRREKVYNEEFNIIKFNTKEEYKKLKKEVSARRQYLNNVIYQKNLQENPLENNKYVLFPRNEHIKYIFFGKSGSGKTKNTMNMLKIYSALNTKTTIIFYFSPVASDKYRDEALHKISEFSKAKIFFFNCQKIKELPTLYQIQDIVLKFKIELNENKQKKLNKPLQTSQFINPNCICIFDDCEGCTSRDVMYDNHPIQISKGIYSLISEISLAGRSHTPEIPTIEYICIQHNFSLSGRLLAFNTIMFETNLIGFNISSINSNSINYINDKYSVELPKRKIKTSKGLVKNPDYPDNIFSFFTLSYPSLLIFEEKCLNLSD